MDQGLGDLHSNFQTEIAEFSYSVNRQELRIENIFVKFFNLAVQRNEQRDEFSVSKKELFAREIIQLLEKLSPAEKPVPKENQEKVEELIKAFKNLVVSL